MDRQDKSAFITLAMMATIEIVAMLGAGFLIDTGFIATGVVILFTTSLIFIATIGVAIIGVIAVSMDE